MSKEPLLTELLEIAGKRPLTEAEQAMLQELLANKDNRLSASAEQHLRANYVSTGQETQWTPQELTQIATNIQKQTDRRSRWQMRQRNLVQFAWVTTVVLGIVAFFLLRFLSINPPVEPPAPVQITPTATLVPSPTPIPTPTLPADYSYIDLVTLPTNPYPEMFQTPVYSLTIAEAMGQWTGDLYIPHQLPDNWSFIGASVDHNQQIIEIAFMQTYFGTDTIWVLSQSSKAERSLTPPLPVVYQPLPRIDNIFDYEDRATNVGERPAHAYQYEYTYEEGTTTWTVYNTVTWQQDEQLFTLTHISRRLEPSTKTAEIAGYLWLQLITENSE